MATKYGTNATILAAPTPSTVLDTEKSGGRVKCLTEKYTGTTINSGDIIYMGKMPKGAIPLYGVLRYTGSDTGALTVGYTGNTDALGAATALATTKTQVLYPDAAQMNVPLTADRDIYATFVGTSATHALVSADILLLHYLYAKD